MHISVSTPTEQIEVNAWDELQIDQTDLNTEFAAIPGQIIPAFENLAESYLHSRFELGYYPSSVEWLVALGVASLGVWIMFAAHKFLPLYEESVEKSV